MSRQLFLQQCFPLEFVCSHGRLDGTRIRKEQQWVSREKIRVSRNAAKRFLILVPLGASSVAMMRPGKEGFRHFCRGASGLFEGAAVELVEELDVGHFDVHGFLV